MFIMFHCKVKSLMKPGESEMNLAVLFAVILLKTLLCKGLALGILLLLFGIQGKKLGFNSESWDDFFLQLSAQTLQRSVIAIYLMSAALSSAVSYLILAAASVPYSLEIAVFLFAAGLAVTAYRWRTKGKDFVLKRYRELANTILSKKDLGKAELE
jgi:hypothetical protein